MIYRNVKIYKTLINNALKNNQIKRSNFLYFFSFFSGMVNVKKLPSGHILGIIFNFVNYIKNKRNSIRYLYLL